MTNEKILDDIAIHVSEFMAKLMGHYPAHEDKIALVLTRNLGTLIAIASKTPDVALERIAANLLATDWKTIRSEHYMHAQGVKKTTELGQPAKVINIGSTQEKPR